MTRFFFTVAALLLLNTFLNAQEKKTASPSTSIYSSIPVSNAELGSFPYFKTLPNFKPTNQSDSVTIEHNLTYFYDGKSFFTIEGKVSAQRLNVTDYKNKIPSEFQIIQEFDKLVLSLGGKKIYAGKLPEEQLKKISKSDIVTLDSKNQVAPYAYYGVIEYVIKTPQKEVWIQLVPGTIKSYYYNLLVVEKQSQYLTTNINKQNSILKDLEKNNKSISKLSFELDNSILLTESKDELLNIVGVFQAHPDWKIKIEIHSAPLGKSDYVLELTEKRAASVKEELVSLGVNSASIQIIGLGDKAPLVSNDTEKGRQTNTRVEISKL
jgi:outer membrane protein OmpA-like peptidoglycan-associated protein